MKVYADEFIQAVETIENIVGKRVAMVVNELNRDSMIECRNLSIGDSNKFGDNFYVNPIICKVNVSDDIHARKLSVEDIGKLIATKVEKSIIRLVEEKIESSETPIARIRDVRKFIKVVVDQDVILEFNDFSLCFRVGIEEYTR